MANIAIELVNKLKTAIKIIFLTIFMTNQVPSVLLMCVGIVDETPLLSLFFNLFTVRISHCDFLLHTGILIGLGR